MANEKIGPDTLARIRAAYPQVLEMLAAGALVGDTLAKAGISHGAMRAFWRLEPGSREDWDAAREQSADAIYEEAMNVARNPFEEMPSSEPGAPPLIVRRDSAHARTYIDTLKWAARIRNPRLYGDRQQIDMNVKTVDLTKIIADANARLIASQVGRVIDGVVIRPQLEDLM